MSGYDERDGGLAADRYVGPADFGLARISLGRITGESAQSRLRRKLAAQAQMAEMLLGQMAQTQARLDAVAHLPEEDPFEDGDMYVFDRTMPVRGGADTSKTYRFVGIRENGRHYISSTTQKTSLSWRALVAFMQEGVTEIRRLHAGEVVVGPETEDERHLRENPELLARIERSIADPGTRVRSGRPVRRTETSGEREREPNAGHPPDAS